jgi:hypothetical protein
MTFEVKKNMQSKAGYNKTSVSITNLSEKHRKDIDSWGAWQGETTALAKCVLYVKYAEAKEWSMLSKTDLFRYKHDFNLPDVTTSFDADDGRLKGDKMVSVPSSLSSSTDPFSSLLKDVGSQMGQVMDAPIAAYPGLAKKVCATGYNFFGKANDALTDMMNSADADFHFMDDEPLIMPYDPVFTVGMGTGLVVSESSGLLGIPERIDDVLTRSGRQSRKNLSAPSTNPGWEITTLLQPKAVPGKWLRLISTRQGIRGNFLIESVTHSGDTHGDEWNSKIRLVDDHA